MSGEDLEHVESGPSDSPGTKIIVGYSVQQRHHIAACILTERDLVSLRAGSAVMMWFDDRVGGRFSVGLVLREAAPAELSNEKICKLLIGKHLDETERERLMKPSDGFEPPREWKAE